MGEESGRPNLRTALFLCWILGSVALANPDKPKVAVFPLGGDAPAEVREKVGFSLRAKLDRDGHYEPIDGPAMVDIAGDKAIDFQTDLKVLTDLSKNAEPTVLIWGEVDGAGSGTKLRIKTFDLNQPDPLPHQFEKSLAQPTDLRFAVEEILQTLDGVKPFEHPSEESVSNDPALAAAFAKNPNLIVDGDFADSNHWQALLGPDVYPPPIADSLPEEDKVNIYRMPDGKGGIRNVLAMNLSKNVAENNGLACLSDAIPIQAGMRYRISFRYRSNGPMLHVFVKGYTTGKDIAGQAAEREVYRRQVPPSDATDGEWKTIVCDMTPANPNFVVEHLRVDLYAYLKPGVVMFDDVQLKAVGPAGK
jgi:hypothetical protein